jgi:hypothetical protein
MQEKLGIEGMEESGGRQIKPLARKKVRRLEEVGALLKFLNCLDYNLGFSQEI